MCLFMCASQPEWQHMKQDLSIKVLHEMNVRHMPKQSLANEMYMECCQANKGHDAGVVYFIFVNQNKSNHFTTLHIQYQPEHDKVT